MADNFNISEWKYNDLISEGKGRDLAQSYIKKMRETFRTLSEEELADFIEEISTAFDLSLKEADDNPCWAGYEMVGMKEKNGQEVPNCVPIK
jgi:hypothetical protein|tara:strand:+ start:1170 stop:1445 length:276 start_codon:yes stop_codon:yes gene_type:complete